MIIETIQGCEIDGRALGVYFGTLVNLLFKILPMREAEEETLSVYMQSLLYELSGCQELFPAIHNDAGFLTILSILQHLISEPDCSVGVVKREIFRAISICNKLKERYAEV